ncbi:MAG: hypothetical protein AAF242_00125 [Bacteroidota bacterium]
MKQIFLDISAAIESVNQINWVDFDLGQLEQSMPPVSFPCALMSFNTAGFTDLANNAQQGDLSITIRIAFRTYERTHNKVSAPKRLAGLAHLDVIDAVHRKVNGLSGDDYTSLSRSSYKTENRADLRIYQMNYTTLFKDDATDDAGQDNGNTKVYRKFKEVTNAEPEFCTQVTTK